MATISDVARAFVEGKARTIGNASTDGTTYWLFGNPIASKGDGVVKFDTCGYRTQSTRRHMNHIASAGKLPGYISMAQRGGVPDQFERPAPWAKPAAPSASGHQPPRKRYHRIDGWRGYQIPAFAVAGSSDTGMYSDSPCPSDAVDRELTRLQMVMHAHGITVKQLGGQTSNVFCGKRWLVVVRAKQFEEAAQLALNWLDEYEDDTRYLHCADQSQLGYKVQRKEVPA